jgi:NtrC-family two-component system sensor histidine kinase KinB
MRTKSLQTRFILAGALLVLTTVGASLWSAWTFARLSAVVGDTLRDNQAAIDLTAALAGALEREDDALLLAVSGNADAARMQLADEKERGEGLYARLLTSLKDDSAEGGLAKRLRKEIDDYRKAGSDLVAAAKEPTALKQYHERVNPLLRQTVATCAKIREVNFSEMQQAGIRARDKASNATWVVAGVSLVAVLLASIVSVWLARSVLLPVRELTACVEALRQSDFDRRVQTESKDELGELAAGFNRMAESLSEYRRSSLGELLSAKTTLEATLNALPDAVFVIDPDQKLVAVNPPATTVLHAKRANDATRVQDLPLLAEHKEAVSLALAGQHNKESPTDFSHTLPVVLAGQRRKFFVTAAPIPEFLPRRTGAVVVLSDVTEFARLEELRGELIGVASHELKTPLTTLTMNLMLLGEKAENLTPRQQEMLAAAMGGCEELGSTIDELLDVTRIEAGQLRLSLATVDLDGLLAQVLRPLQARFDDAGVSVQIQRVCERLMAQADAARVSIVLTNVLTNALKYSPACGTITIRLTSVQNAVPGAPQALQVAVTDMGPGIPAEFRERIFEKFFRVEHHLGQDRHGIRGTGIGLYLCREIIKAHGGTITCEPGNGGVGTCISFTIPRSSN